MGNILKKPMATKPAEIETLEEDKNFKALTILYDCQLCHTFSISPSLNFTNNNCPHTICKHCIAKHINSKLEINAIEITCPSPDCKAVLDSVSCRSIVDDQPYLRWLDRLCYAAIAERKKCYCPYVNCLALIVDECCSLESYPTKSNCPECKRWFCFSCQTAWHEGQQCDLSRRMEVISLNDMLFMEMTMGMEKKLSCCPKCCMYTELVPAPGFCIVRCRFFILPPFIFVSV